MSPDFVRCEYCGEILHISKLRGVMDEDGQSVFVCERCRSGGW